MKDTAARPAAAGGRGIAFALTLTAAMCLGTFMQYGLGVLAPLIIDDLGISASQVGWLSTALYFVAVLCAPQTGAMADRYGGRTMLIGMAAVAGTSFGLAATAGSYAQLVVAVALAGYAAAATNPVTNKIVASDFRGSGIGLLMGVKQSGVKVSQFLAGALLPAAALALGWRGTLLACLLLAGVVATLVMVILPAHSPAKIERAPGARGGPTRTVVWLAAYALLMAVGVSSFSTFLPLYAVTVVGARLAVAGAALAASGVVAIIARIVWGAFAERLPSAFPALGALAVGAGGSHVALALAGHGDLALFWLGALLFGLTGGTWNAVVQLAVVRGVDADRAGRSSGTVHTAFLTGLAAGPSLFALLLSQTSSYAWGWATVAVLSCSAAVVAGWGARPRKPQGQR